MDERESRRKAREREMVNNNTSEKYTQVRMCDVCGLFDCCL